MPEHRIPTRAPRSPAEITSYLAAFTNYETERPLPKWRRAWGPARAIHLLEALALLPTSIPVVQVAGSKGKGSTVMWMEALLSARGARPGSYLSPHLYRLNERIRLAGSPVSDAILLHSLSEVHRVLLQIQDSDPNLLPTFFDLWTAVALHVFQGHGVTHALFEVGLGGPLDSTSAIPHRVGVLTTIDLEHREYLGDTLVQIAREKAGIARKGCPFVVAEPDSDWGRAALARARERGAELVPLTADRPVPTPTLAEPQATNFSTAVAALEALPGEPAVSPREIEAALRTTRIPARLELIAGPPPLLLDSAHTPRSVAHFDRHLRAFAGDRPATVLIGFLQGKEWSLALEGINTLRHRWIVTAPPSPRALEPEVLSESLARRGGDVHCEPNPDTAVRVLIARAQTGDAAAATGSFYLAGLVRRTWPGSP